MGFEHDPKKLKDVRVLLDLARNEIRCDSMVAMRSLLEEILDRHSRGRVHVLKFKNRFAHPTKGGWADIVLYLFFPDDPSLYVFEVQVVHRHLSVMRHQLDGTADYTKTRAATEIMLMLGETSTRITFSEKMCL